jgi:L-alanine-DL-glutamate epimerase-like enolase superfamily enzyme
VFADLPNAGWLKRITWFDAIYADRIIIREGLAAVPRAPGWSIPFDRAAIEKYRIS